MTSFESLTNANDLDAHEMVPLHLWGKEFGESAARVAELVEPFSRRAGTNTLNDPEARDDLEINDENVWHVKGLKAPGSFDLSRRIDVLNQMGIDRQLLFPGFAFFAVQLMLQDSSLLGNDGRQVPQDELTALCRDGLDGYNAWAARITESAGSRVRPVAFLLPAENPDALIAQTRDLIDQGLRSLHLEIGRPIAGLSPGDPALDPFWELFTANDVSCVSHVGGQGDFLRTNQWRMGVPAFALGKVESSEIGMEPYTFATLHLSITNFLACMVLGGVFERHPALRLGIIECGGHWLGPMAESFDLWDREVYHTRLRKYLTMDPSKYIKRNVRVTPFEFEPVQRYISQYPDLADCFCFSTDYPHFEGGVESKKKFYDEVSPLGDDVINKFFVTNGELLLPA